ncbi:MAG: hypothetical protein ACO3L6_04425 [Dehalococcoidia bacterium]
MRLLLLPIAILALAMLTACSDEADSATATAEAGGVDREFLSSRATSTAEQGGYNDQLLIIDATATAQAGGHDDRLEKLYASATAQAIENNATSTAEAIVFDATSTAIAIEDATAEAESPNSGEVQVLKRDASANPVETATPVPPTVTPVPVPTATPEPVAGPWQTAFEAIEIASTAQSGIIKKVAGHVSHKSGQKDAGDVANTTLSPGAGYSSSWGVTILDGDQVYLCVVLNAAAECNTLFSADAGDVEDADVDSPEVFTVWQDNSDWLELLSNEDLSILLVLQPSAGQGSPLIWQAIVTVHGEARGLRGGNFTWNPSTGETSFNTYS